MNESMSRPASSLPSRMPFIVSSGVEKADPTTRKLIRSHVMRGKKQKKRSTAGLAPTYPIQRPQVELREVIDIYTSVQPGRLGTRVYFVDFPAEIEPAMMLKMAQVSAVAMRIIFPLLMEIGFHPDDNAWLYPTGRDVAALHINAFAIQTFIDKVLRRQPEDVINPVATLHHQKGLKLLRERLLGDDGSAKISDDTISAVLKLASAAQFEGDVETAKHHMQGLRQMADLRGGLDVFQDNPKFFVEIVRCDLGIALLANSDPVFYRQANEPIPEYPHQVASSFSRSVLSQEEMKFFQDLDEDLVQNWLVTRKFCLLTNLSTQTRMRMQPATIYGTMIAVMYRLLYMTFTAGSLDETIRLSLLAFTNHIFLQWQDVKPPCHHQFRDAYRNYLQIHALDTVPPQLQLWLLMIGAISIFDVSEDPWLSDYLRRQVKKCRINTWKDLQGILKSFMWIPLLDEKLGEEVYSSLTSQPSASVSKGDRYEYIQESKGVGTNTERSTTERDVNYN